MFEPILNNITNEVKLLDDLYLVVKSKLVLKNTDYIFRSRTLEYVKCVATNSHGSFDQTLAMPVELGKLIRFSIGPNIDLVLLCFVFVIAISGLDDISVKYNNYHGDDFVIVGNSVKFTSWSSKDESNNNAEEFLWFAGDSKYYKYEDRIRSSESKRKSLFKYLLSFTLPILFKTQEDSQIVWLNARIYCKPRFVHKINCTSRAP